MIISCEGETIKLPLSNIIYIEAYLHYITVRTTSGEYRLKESLSSFEKKLNDEFFKVHRSYTVSLKHILQISRTSVHMTDGANIPLSRGKYDEINRAFIEHN